MCCVNTYSQKLNASSNDSCTWYRCSTSMPSVIDAQIHTTTNNRDVDMILRRLVGVFPAYVVGRSRLPSILLESSEVLQKKVTLIAPKICRSDTRTQRQTAYTHAFTHTQAIGNKTQPAETAFGHPLSLHID